MTRYDRSLSAAAAQHDHASPPEEPAFGLEDAAASVSADLDPAELVATLADSAATLAWVSRELLIPPDRRGEFRALLELAESMNRQRSDRYDLLNAPEVDPRD